MKKKRLTQILTTLTVLFAIGINHAQAQMTEERSNNNDTLGRFKIGYGESASISFADPTVKSICVTYWDTNSDGELDENEAAAVKSLGTVFKESQISSFKELKYFTGLTSIGQSAFSNSTVRELTIPENVTKFEKEAFYECMSLKTLNIPEKVTDIGQNALSGCTSMTSITVDKANPNFCDIDGVLFTKDKKTLYQFPAAKKRPLIP